MAITIKTNLDVGAPALSRTAGTLTAVLDWFLRDTLGWTKEYSSTNGGAYRAPTGNRAYYQIDHTTLNLAELKSFVSMSAWNTGAGGTTAAASNIPIAYTTGADATPISYTLISDGTFVMLLIDQGQANIGYAFSAFGDAISYLPSDNFCSLIIGCVGASTSYSGHTNDASFSTSKTLLKAADQTESQKSVALITTSSVLQAYWGGGDIMYPNEVTGGLILFPILIFENTPKVIRGRLPGILSPTRVSTLLGGTTFNGTGDLAGRTYKVYAIGGNGTYMSRIAIETSDTWRT